MSWSSGGSNDQWDSEEADRSWSKSRGSSQYSLESLPNRMSPACIRFCQDSILSEFRNGIPLDDVIDELLRGEVLVEDFAPIRVFLWDGTDIDCEIEGRIDLTTHTYTCDNRRLFVFQQFADRSYDEAPLVLKYGRFQVAVQV